MGSTDLPIVVFDACVLFPLHLRNILVQCAVDRLIEARWTDDIHAEWIDNLLKKKPQLDRSRLERTRDLMKTVLPQADVRTYRDLIPGLRLRDPNDRHVLAAAIASGASTILSLDRGFTTTGLAAYGLTVCRPNGFLMDLYRRDRELLIASVANARSHLRRSKPSAEAFIDAIRNSVAGKLDPFCDLLLEHVDDI